ncbi:MAG: DUF401 family protein, partial [Dehalococcoidales bacterium]|nr:DUF401 family protein [Dehalococcoidales bacterium]
PAGALVSATASRDLVKRVGLNPEQSTFINFWFRHIWEFSMPIYPAIIITSVILSLPLFTVVKTLAPVSALAIIAGGAVSYRILKNIPPVDAKPTKKIVYNLLRAAWPILLLVPLILLGMDAMLAFPLTLLLLAVQQRANWPELRKSLKYGADVKILFMLYAIMLYKATIESSGAASVLIADMQTIGLPAAVMLVALPLLIGLATGISMAFAGITLPLLIPYILTDSGLNTYALLTAYVSGMMGLLLSPLHLCFILSAAYFQANLARMYRYLLPLTMTMEAIVISIYLITA